ncbi:type I addiction module toxin, SymE family [Pectobacterium versatile]|nr:type I addiction module toxin, SymE family [Pectobacterium versatile]
MSRVVIGISLQFKLSGKWLEELVFNTDQSIIVTVERGQLVIKPKH